MRNMYVIYEIHIYLYTYRYTHTHSHMNVFTYASSDIGKEKWTSYILCMPYLHSYVENILSLYIRTHIYAYLWECVCVCVWDWQLFDAFIFL